MYTFLGEGSQKPPRINVAVAPGTLIYHVLNNCQPVFISNIATFPGRWAAGRGGALPTGACCCLFCFACASSRTSTHASASTAPADTRARTCCCCNGICAGPYSDVQFMRFVLGLKSVTCLPLVVAGSRILGVLRLGFEDSWNWVEHEKVGGQPYAFRFPCSRVAMGLPGAICLAWTGRCCLSCCTSLRVCLISTLSPTNPPFSRRASRSSWHWC